MHRSRAAARRSRSPRGSASRPRRRSGRGGGTATRGSTARPPPSPTASRACRPCRARRVPRPSRRGRTRRRSRASRRRSARGPGGCRARRGLRRPRTRRSRGTARPCRGSRCRWRRRTGRCRGRRHRSSPRGSPSRRTRAARNRRSGPGRPVRGRGRHAAWQEPNRTNARSARRTARTRMRRMSRLTKRMAALYSASRPQRPRAADRPPTRATEPTMFSRWGAFVYRHRRIVLVLAIASGSSRASAPGRAASVLSAGGWLDPDSESAAVTNRLADEFGSGRGALIAVYRGEDGSDAKGAAFQAAIAASLADIVKDPAWTRRSGTRRPAKPVHLERRALRLRRHRPQRHRRGVGPADRPVQVGIHKPADGIEMLFGGYAALTRTRPSSPSRTSSRRRRSPFRSSPSS